MTTARFVIGIVTLAAIAAPHTLVGLMVERRLTPRHVSLRVLAAAIIAVASLIVTAELLGAVGLFRPAALLIGSGAVAAAVFVVSRRLAPPTPEIEPPSDRSDPSRLAPRWVSFAAVAAVGGVACRWLALTIQSLELGVRDVDSRQYHLPFATEFVRTGWLTKSHPIWVDPVHLFYPANSELLQAVGMITMGRDVLAPLPNLGWFILFIFAGWCTGVRDGVAPLTLLAAGAVAGIPLLVWTSGGSALSDIAMLACLLSAIALWRNADGDLGWLALSGLALGLAVATKLTVGPTAVALVTAWVLLTSPRRRRAAIAALAAALAVGGAFWFVRNLVRTGSPMPSLSIPLLPRVDLPLVDRFGAPVAEYVTDSDFVRDVLVREVRRFFGWAGLIGAVGIAIAVPFIVRAKDRGVQALAACGLVGLLGYLAVPAGAWEGIDGEPVPVLVWVNIRYALPGLAVLGVAAALAMASASPRWRAGFAAAAATAIAVEVVRPNAFVVPDRYVVASLAGLAVLAAAAAAARLLPAPGQLKWAAGALAVVLAVVVAGPPGARRQLQNSAAFGDAGAGRVFTWASSVSPARIGYYSVLGHYPMYAPDWSNDLVYIGVRTPHGGFRSVATCDEYIRVLERGRFDYVVLGPPGNVFDDTDLPEWTASQAGVTLVFNAPPYSVFEVAPPYDATACPDAS